MPQALVWTADQDARLMALLDGSKALSLRQAAKAMGLSRSFVHRRALALREAARPVVAAARQEAGDAPLQPGHPISWEAIRLSIVQTTASWRGPVA